MYPAIHAGNAPAFGDTGGDLPQQPTRLCQPQGPHPPAALVQPVCAALPGLPPPGTLPMRAHTLALRAHTLSPALSPHARTLSLSAHTDSHRSTRTHLRLPRARVLRMPVSMAGPDCLPDHHATDRELKRNMRASDIHAQCLVDTLVSECAHSWRLEAHFSPAPAVPHAQ